MITENPSWVPLTATEIEGKIEELAKDGVTPAMIGMILRDQYAVPNVKLATGKSVTEILAEKGLKGSMPEDLEALYRRAINLNNHLKMNHNDVANRRGMQLIEAKIRRLEAYYRDNGVLPETWRYSIANAELMLK